MSLKDVKVNFLVDVATELFVERSISEVTMKDIASAAEIGEATLFRYFGKKQAIVAMSVMKLQGIVNERYFKLNDGGQQVVLLAVEDVNQPETVQPKKIYRDGKILIEHNGLYYDLLGNKQ